MEENRAGRRSGVRGASSKEEHKVSFIQEVLRIFYRPGTVLNNKIIEKCALKVVRLFLACHLAPCGSLAIVGVPWLVDLCFLHVVFSLCVCVCPIFSFFENGSHVGLANSILV